MTYVAQAAPNAYPQAYVNRIEAQAACEAAGKRLCTLGEWFRACKTTKGSLYPYGGKYERGACNSGKPHLLSQLFGRDAKKWKFMEHFNSPALSAEPGFLAKSAEYSRCTNDRGISDMVGNLHEWVSDTVDHDLPNKVPLRDDIRDKIGINMGHAIFMGGFYGNVNEHGEGCAYLTPGHGKKYHDYTTGFRCCRDVTPAG